MNVDTPKVLRPSTMADRKADRLIDEANSPRDLRLRGTTSTIAEHHIVDRRNPNISKGTYFVQTFVKRGSGQYVASRQIDPDTGESSPLEFAEPGQPSASVEVIAVVKARRRAGVGPVTPPNIIGEGTMPAPGWRKRKNQ